jgi:hypothetical protein
LSTHQRFVKTTPKPNATKNRSGELVGPGLPPPWALGLDDAEATAEVEVGVDIVVIYFRCPFGLNGGGFRSQAEHNSMLSGLQKRCCQDPFKSCSQLFPPPLLPISCLRKVRALDSDGHRR